MLGACTLAALLLCAARRRAVASDGLFGRVGADLQRPVPDDPDTLEISAVDEFFVTQTQRFVSVEHTAKPGSHPAAGTFDFGVRGTVGGIPGGLQHELTLSVGFFGTQLIISENNTDADATGVRVTTGHGSIWLLDPDGRLVIEFREARSKERPKTATRVYIRKG